MTEPRVAHHVPPAQLVADCAVEPPTGEAARLAAVQELMTALADAATPEAVAGTVITRAAAIVNASVGVVALATADGTALELVHAAGLAPALADQWRRLPADAASPLAEVARTGRPLLLPAVAAAGDAAATTELASAAQSWAALPLVIGARTLGVLALGWRKPHAFDEAETALLLLLAGQCAQALERARLREAERRARAVAEGITRHLVVQNAVARMLATATHAEVPPQVLEAICEGLGWDWGCLWYLDRPAGLLRSTTMWHQPGAAFLRFADVSRSTPLSQGRGLPGQVWASGETTWIVDMAQERACLRAAAATAADLHSAIYTPIRGGGEVVGVLEFLQRGVRPRDPDVVATISAIGSQLGRFFERRWTEEERSTLLAREQAAHAQAEAERQRYLDLVQGLDAIIWEADAATLQFTFISQQAETILGYPATRWLTDPHFWAQHMHPEDRTWAVDYCRTCTSAGESHQFDYRIIAADGRTVWLRDLVKVVTDERGKPTRLRGVMVDITERKAAETALTARVRQQAAVARLGQQALVGMDMAALMDEAARLVTATLEVELCEILDLLPDDSGLRLQAGVGWRPGLVGHATVGAGRDSQAGYTLASAEPVIVEDLPNERRFKPPRLLSEHDALSGLTCIIGGREKPFGVLGAHTTTRRTFTQDDIYFLQAVANVLAMAIERQRSDMEREALLASEQKALAEAEAASARLAFLSEASAALITSLDEREILHRLANLSVPLLADLCFFDALTADGRVQRVAWRHADPAQQTLLEQVWRFTPSLDYETHPIARALRTGAPELVPDVDEAWRRRVATTAEHLAYLQALDFQSLMTVPLVTEERILGAMTFCHTPRSGRRHGPADLALAQELARRAALAVEHAQLHAEVRAAHATAEAAVQARDEFLSIASHELRNPVAGLKATAQLLRRRFMRGQVDQPQIERYTAMIEQAGERLAVLTNDLLDVSRLQHGRLPLRQRPTDLAALVRTAVARLQGDAIQHRIALDIAADLEPLNLDADRIEQVVTNLLDNAIKYSPQGGTVRLSLERDGAGLALRVRDEGIGLPEASLERIFEPFGRAANATAQNIPGLGLGLYICRQIAEQHGGRLWAKSAGEGQGTTMVLWLPVDQGPAGAAADGE